MRLTSCVATFKTYFLCSHIKVQQIKLTSYVAPFKYNIYDFLLV